MTADEYRKQIGEWTVATIKSFSGWPSEYKIIEFRQRKFLMMPETDDYYPAIAIKRKKNDNWKNIEILIENLLSSISWVKKSAFWVDEWSGGPYPKPILKDRKTYIIVDNDLPPRMLNDPSNWLPEPTNPDARLALALFREALYLNNIAYKFLSFYKIINLRFPKSKHDQIKWINDNLEIVRWDADERIDQLRNDHDDIGDYLYKSCRCAVAHAGEKPNHDPDNYDDKKRLSNDLPVIRELAIILIEKEYGVESLISSRTRKI